MKNSKIFIVAVLFASLLTSSCTKSLLLIHGNGDIVTETLNINPFTKLIMNGAFETVITYGTEQQVMVTGDSNIVDLIKTGVSNESL